MPELNDYEKNLVEMLEEKEREEHFDFGIGIKWYWYVVFLIICSGFAYYVYGTHALDFPQDVDEFAKFTYEFMRVLIKYFVAPVSILMGFISLICIPIALSRKDKRV